MQLLNIKDLIPKGDGEVYSSERGLDISSRKQAYILSERFSTTCDNVSVSTYGEIFSGGATLNLYGLTGDGEKILERSDRLPSGRFSLSYEYDPISLAVYKGIESFFLEVELLPFSHLIVSELSVTEVVALIGTESEIRKNTVKNKKIPNRMLFIGNSLVFGMQLYYGMCASAPDKDYFHYVTEYVRGKNPECVFEKLYGSNYEHSESLEAFEDWYSKAENQYTHRPSAESFTSDLDIIIIQLGDNINTDAKNETFKISGDILIERIKKASPNARIIWVHGWYNREPTYSYISSLCERQGIERIDIRDLRCIENEAHTEDCFLDTNGTLTPIKDTWKTHPGDTGMKLIAQRLIEQLGF